MFELFEHTADVGVRGVGRTIEESFEETAKAMTSILVDLNTIEEKKTITIEAEADSLEELLFEWLNEILAQIDIEGMIFSKFKITKLQNNKLEAELTGEQLSPAKHHTKTQVKAATYSQLKVYQNKKGGAIFFRLIIKKVLSLSNELLF